MSACASRSRKRNLSDRPERGFEPLTPRDRRTAFVLFAFVAACWGAAALQDAALGRPWQRLDRLERRTAYGSIDPNAASVDELQALPGIGPSLARRIVAERERGGPYRSLDDLQRVAGIGPKTAERLRPWIRTEPSERRRR